MSSRGPAANPLCVKSINIFSFPDWTHPTKAGRGRADLQKPTIGLSPRKLMPSKIQSGVSTKEAGKGLKESTAINQPNEGLKISDPQTSKEPQGAQASHDQCRGGGQSCSSADAVSNAQQTIRLQGPLGFSAKDGRNGAGILQNMSASIVPVHTSRRGWRMETGQSGWSSRSPLPNRLNRGLT